MGAFACRIFSSEALARADLLKGFLKVATWCVKSGLRLTQSHCPGGDRVPRLFLPGTSHRLQAKQLIRLDPGFDFGTGIPTTHVPEVDRRTRSKRCSLGRGSTMAVFRHFGGGAAKFGALPSMRWHEPAAVTATQANAEANHVVC
jgi:hypothetical protein